MSRLIDEAHERAAERRGEFQPIRRRPGPIEPPQVHPAPLVLLGMLAVAALAITLRPAGDDLAVAWPTAIPSAAPAPAVAPAPAYEPTAALPHIGAEQASETELLPTIEGVALADWEAAGQPAPAWQPAPVVEPTPSDLIPLPTEAPAYCGPFVAPCDATPYPNYVQVRP